MSISELEYLTPSTLEYAMKFRRVEKPLERDKCLAWKEKAIDLHKRQT